MMAAGVTISSLQEVLSEQSAFTRELDFRVRAIGEGECELVVPFQLTEAGEVLSHHTLTYARPARAEQREGGGL